ncbi:hypothetical protein I6G82_08535 [Lysinibacillus macroides]|uniref:Uncharacterized protein n=1 Tax=Lysinibacillus macroides TaxID=33935 RepID=A0A0N0CVF4_9BACI|nr:hypothetical protein [Lysinibacillus macroides]KOY81547.1 hypothetical protein ADM90_14150 [Lysinibacillus macroides]QPR69616.1 hypothetical protein I6G82_08535 [Lysinibacillus macroides]
MNALNLTDPQQFAKALLEMSGVTKEVVMEAYMKKLEEDASSSRILWELKDLEEATTFTGNALETKFLQDPRILQYQRQDVPRGKRVWLREPTAKVIYEIVQNEWLCVGAIKEF